MRNLANSPPPNLHGIFPATICPICSAHPHIFLSFQQHTARFFRSFLSWLVSFCILVATLNMWSSPRQYSLLAPDADEGDSCSTEPFRPHTLRGRWRERCATSLISQITLVVLVGSLGFILGIVVSWERKLSGEKLDAVSRGT